MTDLEWLQCTDPRQMLRAVGGPDATLRKSRLFCCAYCRWFFWKHLAAGLRHAVEVAEDYADGLVGKSALRSARAAFDTAKVTTNAQWRAHFVAQIATSAHDPFSSALLLLENRNTAPLRGGRKAAAELVREVFGMPLAPPVVLGAAVLAWNDATVVQLARGIYEERAFDRLPILADALEDAGCASEDALAHCRAGGEHARGCWVLDLILGAD